MVESWDSQEQALTGQQFNLHDNNYDHDADEQSSKGSGMNFVRHGISVYVESKVSHVCKYHVKKV